MSGKRKSDALAETKQEQDPNEDLRLAREETAVALQEAATAQQELESARQEIGNLQMARQEAATARLETATAQQELASAPQGMSHSSTEIENPLPVTAHPICKSIQKNLLKVGSLKLTDLCSVCTSLNVSCPIGCHPGDYAVQSALIQQETALGKRKRSVMSSSSEEEENVIDLTASSRSRSTDDSLFERS